VSISQSPLRISRRRLHRLTARFFALLPLLLVVIGLIVAVLVIVLGCAAPAARNDPSTLRLRLASDPLTLDPALAADEASTSVISQIFDGLVDLDPLTGEPRPCLARSWQIDETGKRYVFTLRHSARFHNGRRVEADDVVFSLERLLSPSLDSTQRWILSQVRGSRAFQEGRTVRLAGLRALDPRTVAIELEDPHGPFLSLLALEAASILPREVYSDPGESTLRAPVGAGPFEFRRWDRGSQIVLAATPYHHGGIPALHRIVYRVIPSVSESLEQYLAGALDVLDEIPGGRRSELAGLLGEEIRHHAQPAVAFLSFNHMRPPFRGNRALRRAFNHAIDRKALCRQAGKAEDLPATGIVPPGIAGHDHGARGYAYDPDRARLLLSTAGYPGGRGLPEITLAYARSASHRQACQRIRTDLRKIGVKVSLLEHDTSTLMNAIHGGEEGASELLLFRMAWLADYPDPEAFLRPTLHSSSPPAAGNFGRYSNLMFDRVLDQARSEPDPARRMRLYRRAERMAVDDAAWVFLYFYGDDALVKPHVANFIIPTFGELLGPLHEVRLYPGMRLARF
jgi:peptide/nickel transport system substrate-binding protein/oligopeptide transport system substrate-binding protein